MDPLMAKLEKENNALRDALFYWLPEGHSVEEEMKQFMTKEAKDGSTDGDVPTELTDAD